MKFKGWKTQKAYIDIVGDGTEVIKRYIDCSDVDWEVNMSKKFKSRHSFELQKVGHDSVRMPRFLMGLGT